MPSKAAKPSTPATNPAHSSKVSDDAVLKATGKSWADWITRLDKAGAAEMTHAQIAEHLSTKERVGDWWAQMVTVGYEQAKGRRAKHEKPDGFSISASKTFDAPLETLFAAFTDARRRSRWLPATDLTLRKTTEFKSVRITWNSGIGIKGEAGTSIEVNLYDKTTKAGIIKSSAQLQHNKLPTAAAAEHAKAWWKDRLETLKDVLDASA